MIPRTAATVAGVLLAAVVAFQAALILGAPWGELTQGGRADGALDATGRAVAGASIVILVSLALGLLGRVGWGPLRHHRRISTVLSWVAVAYGAMAVMLNAATPSAVERVIWLPVSVLLLAAALVTVLGSRRRSGSDAGRS